ncbi:hypothetical protein BJF83_21340 [Nocardiopsis sp. CNR-923]|nr:hypothetical protein BJF83_21340 [Nocardiopsis sp. CNR-923]
MGTAIRTTVGAPRWALSYTLAGHAQLITPTRDMLGLDRSPYRKRYEARLSATGLYRIATELRSLARGRLEPLVLLCFDRLGKPGPDSWCHRTMFAVWWEEQTGVEVPELGAVALPEPPTLF